MSDTENQCDCGFHEGDWVECKLNTDIIGIVIGDADYGRIVNVQLAGSLEVKPFFAVTLRHVTDDTVPPAKAEEPTPDNVVVVDFTKKQDLRGAKPAGRA